MASRDSIVQQMMDEFGKTSQVVRAKVERVVGEITIDILSNNFGKFRKLREVKDFDIRTTKRSYKLPGNFNSDSNQFYEVDSDGEVLREIEIVTEQRFFERKTDANYTGSIYAYIETKKSGTEGPGEFLTLNGLPSATGTFRMPYYRKPTVNDTDVITNERTLKEGIRSAFSEFVPDFQTKLVIYEKMKAGTIETPATRTTGMTLKPSKRQQQRNRNMYWIGKGQ